METIANNENGNYRDVLSLTRNIVVSNESHCFRCVSLLTTRRQALEYE